MSRIAPILLFLGLAFATAGHAASSSKVFSIANTGDGPMTISGAGISGNTAEFVLTGNTCTSVAVGASCALTVTFTPAGSDARGAAWLNFSSDANNGTAHSIQLAGAGGASEVTRVISANTADVNMAALFGNPTTSGTYVLTINSGVYVTASSTAVAALFTGSFPAGSTVKIVNNGYILGRGGAGGAGGYNNVGGSPGAAGGPALTLATSVTVDNSFGTIGGGGGGGGGGGNWAGKGCYGSTGGGGGGGAYAGAGGASTYSGATGGALVGGAGGAKYSCGGNGGAGGALGYPGAAGGNAVAGSAYPGAGGPAGRAVVTNGNSITWLGGNDAAHVLGAIQ